MVVLDGTSTYMQVDLQRDVTPWIQHNLQEKRVVLIAQDSFYRGLTQEEHDNVSSYNFDHPDAIDVAALVETLRNLALRNEVKVPIYDFVTHSRKEDESVTVEPADVIIVEEYKRFKKPDVPQVKLAPSLGDDVLPVSPEKTIDG